METRRGSIAKAMLPKLRSYLDELKWIYSVTPDAHNWFRLSLASVGFHLSNAMNRSENLRPEKARRYTMWAGQKLIDVWIRPRSGDVFVLHEVIGESTYEVPQLKEPEVVVDLGANIGMSTVYLAARFPKARFICVEPDPANVVLLALNTRHLDNVEIVQGAAAGESGQRTFHIGDRSWAGGLEGAGRDETVRAWSMNEVIETFGISRVGLLKVDIEGAETELFSVNAEWLSKVDYIIAELHPPYGIEQFEKEVGAWGLNVIPPEKGLGNNLPVAIRPESPPQA
ncbi:MAG TPA: FkbM family methyltransferase [Actinomycetota bacterium]|nr:FkbM family methyltransferase [Actinomycetota bacterium]